MFCHVAARLGGKKLQCRRSAIGTDVYDSVKIVVGGPPIQGSSKRRADA
jgi:hypothetical protein